MTAMVCSDWWMFGVNGIGHSRTLIKNEMEISEETLTNSGTKRDWISETKEKTVGFIGPKYALCKISYHHTRDEEDKKTSTEPSGFWIGDRWNLVCSMPIGGMGS